MASSSMTQGAASEGGGGAGRSARALALAWVLFLSCLIITAGAIAFLGKASDGQPVASLVLASGTKPQGAARTTGNAQSKPGMSASIQPPADQQSEEPEPPSQPPITAPVYAGGALVADPALIEQTEQGPLPRVADDGRMPLVAYAPPYSADKRPRVAIVVTGLGISAKATSVALATLPPAVTLAFAPYASDVQHWVSEARRLGHEVLLEVPMEPFDFPDSDPGPHTLRAASSEDENIQRLGWSMTRFTGYVGVTNLLGGRFLANSEALSPVMTFVSRRGLMFFDSGSATHSAASDVAHDSNAPFAASNVTIDMIQTGMEIDRRLTDLETTARNQGRAAGTGFIYPITLDRVQNWAKGLSGRGLVLVPVSAIVQGSN